MSVGTKLLQAAAGNAGEAVYVDDVFSTDLLESSGGSEGIKNGINLGDFGVGTSTEFNGTSDYLSRSSDLTGNADGKTLTFSCWVFLGPLVSGTTQRVMYATDSSDNGIAINISDTGVVGLEAGSGGSWSMQASTTSLPIGLNAWTHILISFDLTNSSNRYIYINDVAASVTWHSYGNSNIDFTRSTHYIGAWGNGTRKINDNMAHFYLDYTYRDLSTESNRRLFIDANGGSTSASSLAALNPIMYLPMTTAYAVGKNAGTGGDFTANGSPTIVENGTEYVAGSGEGGLVWWKNRTLTNGNGNHRLSDTERGVDKSLISNGTYADIAGPNESVTSFNTNGFVFENGQGGAYDYVTWTFRKAPGFFDVVTYTGTGSAQNISHNLGSVPGCIIIKNRSNTADWTVYHRGVDASSPEDYNLALNKTDARDDNVAYFNDTAPTSTVFTVNSDSTTNTNGDTYVAYLFAHDAQDFGTDSDESIIKCGSFTNNLASVGVEVNLGFEPQWLLIKGASSDSGLGNWVLIDNMRGASVDSQQRIYANSSAAEGSSNWFKFTSQGFTPNTYFDGTLIYVAIRRPNKPASEFAATDLFSPLTSQPITGGIFNHSHLADFSLYKYTNGSQSWAAQDRLRGAPDLSTDSNAAENGLVGGNAWDRMEGYINPNPGAGNYSSWAWRRAPGYFDVVAYTGTGSAHAENHGLGVVPEMIWVKERNGATNWNVYSKTSGATKYLLLNATQGENTWAGYWNDTTPTSTQFTVGTDASNNSSGDNYIAYLFASVPGISKVGSYTGTGSDLNVDCGFSAGARFVLIKRTDATGDWYVYDSVQGIVAGNDPYLLLNTTAAQVTGTDYIDPLSSGFTVTSSAPTGLNASSGTYLFYAIA